MPSFSWEEMSDLKHLLKNERVVIFGAISKLKRVDSKLKDVEDRIDDIIFKHEKDD